ncbi:hypothetical protein NKDENANG_00726 [Candidatus Entotheonellaceae bacterium PAL068K]
MLNPATLMINAFVERLKNGVCHDLEDGLRHLRVTQEGKQWFANLDVHIFAAEHQEL